MARLLLFLLSVLLVLSASAQIYKRIGPDGVVIYSDHRTKDAEAVGLPGLNSYRTPPPPAVPWTAPSPSSRPGSTAQAYRRLAVVQPQQEETLQHNGGRIAVSLLLEPPLQPGHRIRLVVNGQPQAETLTSTQFSLTNMSRGTNSIQAQVIDGDNAVLISSDPVTFYVFQPTVAPRAASP